MAVIDHLVLWDVFSYMEEQESMAYKVISHLRQRVVQHVLEADVGADEADEEKKHQKMAEFAENYVEQMFRDLDVNGDGSLSPRELQFGLYRFFQLYYSTLEFRKVMRVLDPDRSNSVDFDEFTHCIFGHAHNPMANRIAPQLEEAHQAVLSHLRWRSKIRRSSQRRLSLEQSSFGDSSPAV
jgi:hypothetical protein